MPSHPSVWDLRDCTGIELTLRGDGRRYKLRLKADPGFDGVNWETAFATDAGKRQAVLYVDRERPENLESQPGGREGFQITCIGEEGKHLLQRVRQK